MVQALITINGIAGSNPPNGVPLIINSVVQLDNINNGGEISWLYEFLDRPEGSLASFSNPAIQNPTFTPDVEGTYLIRLKVNATLVSEQIDTVIAAVLHQKTNLRIPAALETTESSALRGWAQDVNRQLRLLTNFKGDPGTFVCISTSGNVRGNVVTFDSASTINTGLPEEELLPSASTALATSAADMLQPLFVVESAIDGDTTVGTGELMNVRESGFYGPVSSLGAPVVGDPVYVSNLGLISDLAGTNVRIIGRVAYVSGGNYYAVINGAMGAGTAPSTANYLVQGGSRAGLPNAIDVTALSAAVAFVNPGIGAVTSYSANGVALGTWSATGLVMQSGTIITTAAAQDQHIHASGHVRIYPAFTETWRFTSTGALAAQGGNRLISNVADPVGNQDAATKIWVVDNMFYLMNYTFGDSAVNAGGATSYLDPFYQKATSGATEISLEVPIACTAIAASIRSAAAGGVAAEDIVYTVRKNGADTALVVTCPNTDTSASSIGAIAFAQGDKVSVKAVASAGAASPANNIFEIRFSTAV